MAKKINRKKPNRELTATLEKKGLGDAQKLMDDFVSSGSKTKKENKPQKKKKAHEARHKLTVYVDEDVYFEIEEMLFQKKKKTRGEVSIAKGDLVNLALQQMLKELKENESTWDLLLERRNTIKEKQYQQR